MKIKRVFVIVVIFLLTFTSLIYAHKPIFNDGTNISINESIKIDNPEISWAVYGELTHDSNVHYYKIDGKRGMDLYVQMTIPKIKDNEDFTPSIAILGKEFEKPEIEVPFEVPEGYGVKIIEPVEVKEEFFEPFTQTRYLMRQEETIKLENDAPYYIVVYDNVKEEGKYTLTVGRKEEFKIKDILLFPLTWIRVRLWYNKFQTFLIIVLVITIITLLIKSIKTLFKK